MKFGGSSLASAERIGHVAELVRRTREQPGAQTPVLVVSAMGGVTDRLFAIARTAVQGRSGQGAALEQVEALREHHVQALHSLITGSAERETARAVVGGGEAGRTAPTRDAGENRGAERHASGDAAERPILGDAAERIDAYFAELRDIVIGVSLLGELSPRSLDAITGYGEKLSAQLVAVALRAARTPAE